MEGPGQARILKRSPARSVRLEPSAPPPGGAPERVVKRFARDGILAGARDGARARREHELLVLLHDLGLPVPRPLGVERREGAWEVAMEWIPDARSLAEVLAGQAPWPAPAGRLARELGRLLARLHAAGLDHPDLHPGNVLLDGSGRVWAIDFHKARLSERMAPGRLEEHLAHLAEGARERTSRRFRARFLWAWWRALPPERRPRLGPAALAARAEERGRRARLPTVERRRLRWTRDGTAVRAVQLAGGDGYERADAQPGLARALEAALEREGSGGARTLLRCPAGGDERRVLALRGAWRAISAAWYGAARLEEHALPAARPLAIARGSRPWAAFSLPARGHVPAAWAGLRTTLSLRSLGALAGALYDRGLSLARLAPEELWVDERGGVQLSCVSGLRRALEVPAARALRPWCAVLGAGSRERATLCAGFLRALDLSRSERATVRTSLRRG